MVTHDLRMVEYTDRVFEILDGGLTHVERPSALGHDTRRRHHLSRGPPWQMRPLLLCGRSAQRSW